MLFAYDEQGNKIHISDYNNGDVFCPDGHRLVAKRGDVRMHHFSHRSNCKCRFSCNKGEWHQKFQDRARRENQEVRIELAGKLHIADVCVGVFVIEYQHSHISREEIIERESFYTSCGYTLVWVFDTSMWDYHILERKGKEVTMIKRRGSDFPMLGSYISPIIKIFDFNKKDLLMISSQKGNKIIGTLLSMVEFDRQFIQNENEDVRIFHHPI